MKCKNKSVKVMGFEYNDLTGRVSPYQFEVIITNDVIGKHFRSITGQFNSLSHLSQLKNI